MNRLFLALVLAFSVACGHASSYANMVDAVSGSVVRVTYTGSSGVCSGEVIAKNRVLTAEHCVAPGALIDGDEATLITADKFYDLALYDVNTDKLPLTLRDAPVERFEELTSIGYGFGWTTLTVLQSRAVIEAQVPYPGAAAGIITQGNPTHGMSGGPVVDPDGQMVGIVQQSNEGLGYGVPVLIIRAFLLGLE